MLAVKEVPLCVAVAVLLRFAEVVPHLKPASVTDPVNDEYEPDRVAPV